MILLIEFLLPSFLSTLKNKAHIAFRGGGRPAGAPVVAPAC
jgi:hypothetical protein